jgi:hypothetical protein
MLSEQFVAQILTRLDGMMELNDCQDWIFETIRMLACMHEQFLGWHVSVGESVSNSVILALVHNQHTASSFGHHLILLLNVHGMQTIIVTCVIDG